MASLEELESTAASIKSMLRFHRSNLKNRANVLHSLEAKRRTIEKLIAEVAAVEQSLEDGPAEIERLLDRLDAVNKKLVVKRNEKDIERLLDLHAKIQEAAS